MFQASWIISLILSFGFLCSRCSAHIGPKLRHRNMKEYFGRPSDPQQHLDTVLRSEFQAHLSYNVRVLRDKLMEITQTARHALDTDDRDMEMEHENPIRAVSSSPVAFAVRASAPSVGQDKRLVFNELLLNEGGGYDPAKNCFVAPVAGAYSITLTGHGHCGTEFSCTRLAINGQQASGWCAEWTGQSASREIVQLIEGDELCLLADYAAHDRAACLSGTEQNAGEQDVFSGYLIV